MQKANNQLKNVLVWWEVILKPTQTRVENTKIKEEQKYCKHWNHRKENIKSIQMALDSFKKEGGGRDPKRKRLAMKSNFK